MWWIGEIGLDPFAWDQTQTHVFVTRWSSVHTKPVHRMGPKVYYSRSLSTQLRRGAWWKHWEDRGSEERNWSPSPQANSPGQCHWALSDSSIIFAEKAILYNYGRLLLLLFSLTGILLRSTVHGILPVLHSMKCALLYANKDPSLLSNVSAQLLWRNAESRRSKWMLCSTKDSKEAGEVLLLKLQFTKWRENE